MDEELRKRSTDCVYFLASPLTCKKGIECEYRHSDIARLNPRDCWYWLAGSCLNPTCAFRHPPLDGRVEASSDAALPQHHSSIPVNKTNVPCYFYFNGFCYKGDKCSFLHGPDDNAPAWKSLKTAAAVTDAPTLEKKTFAGSDTGSADSAPIPTLPNIFENAAKKVSKVQIEPKEDLHELFPANVTERSASTHISASELEEAAAVQLGSLLSAEGLVQNRSLICTDHSSEDQVEGHFEREEWLESSPGFDVLVDDESENLIYNDDPEYLLALDGEQRGLDSHFLGYDYEDHVEYVPAYPDAAIMYEQNIDEDAYNHLDNEHAYDYMRKSPRHSGERKSDPILSSKRKIFPMEMSIDGHRDVDLHHHIKKRRMIGGHPVTRFSRRHNSSQLIGQSMERSRRQHAQQVHGRLALEAENCIIRSINSRDVLMNGAKKRGGFRNSRMNKSRQSYKDKEAKHRFLSSEISKKQLSKNKRSIEDSAMFTGPKTLAEIKAEKRKARGNEVFFGKMGYSSRNRSEDFQGPKPLSEILKDKRRLDSVIDDSS